jgi:hypothetical protein
MTYSLQSEEYLKKKRKRKLIKIGIGVFSFIAIMLILAWAAHRPKLRISRVELSGGVLVTQADVQKEALSFLSGSYLWLYPKDNAFLYPRTAVTADIKDHFKRIDKISVKLKDTHTLAVEISERTPKALWCSGDPEAGEPTGDCYFMDGNSTIYTEAPDFSGDAYFKYYGGLATDTPPVGTDYMASSTQFADLSAFIDRAKRLSVKPLYLLAKGNGEYSLVLAGGGQIYFDIKEPLSVVGDNLEALLHAPALATSTAHSLPIQYIDLRFGNKLFYKLK